MALQNSKTLQTVCLDNGELNLDKLSLEQDGMYEIDSNGKCIGRVSKRNGRILISIKGSDDITCSGTTPINKFHIKSKGQVNLRTTLKACENAIIDAENVHVQSELSAKSVKIDAKNEFINHQSIDGDTITVNAKSVQQNGVCNATKKLKIQSKAYRSTDSSLTKSGNKFVFLGDQIDIHGNFTAQGLAFFSAKTLHTHNQCTLPPNTYMHISSLHLKDKSNLTLDGQTDSASIHIDKDINIDAESSFYTKNTTVIASSIKNAGSFHTEHGPLNANQFQNRGKVSFKYATVNFKYKMIGENTSAYTINNSTITTKTIKTASGGNFTATQANIHSETAELMNDTTLSMTNWTSNYLQQGGKSTYQACKMTFKNDYHLLPCATLNANTSIFSGESMNCGGAVNLDNSSISLHKNIKNTASLGLNNSVIDADGIISTSKSTVTLQNNSSVVTKETIRLDGINTFDHATLNSNEIILGKTTLNSTSLSAKELIRINEISGDQVHLNAPTIDYLAKHDLTNATIKSTLSSQSGDGTFKNSQIETQFDSVEDDASLTLSNSFYQSSFLSSSGKVKLQQVQAKIDDVNLSHGSLNASNSEVDVKSSTLSATDTTIELTESKAQLNDALLEGRVIANASEIYAKNLVMTNTNTFTQSKVKASHSLNLQGHQTLTHSTLEGKDVSLNGQVNSHADSTIQANNDLTATPKSTVKLNKSILKAQNAMRLFGEMTADQAELIAKDISNYHKLKAKQSKLSANDSMTLANVSDTTIESNTSINASNVDLHGKLTTTESRITTTADITYHPSSNTTTNNLTLSAGGELSFHLGSQITGNILNAKADVIINEGKVHTTSQLSLDANYIVNQGGSLGSDANTNLIAARILANTGGRIYGTNTQVNALGIVNAASEIYGQDSLTLNSLANINAGLYRSYNVNTNSIVNLNTGLILPTIPSSRETAIDYHHVRSAIKIIATNALPEKANLINFIYQVGVMAYPTLEQFSKKAYSIARDKDRHWNELLPSIPTLSDISAKAHEGLETIKTKRIVDYMVPLLSIKSLAVGATGLYQSGTNLTSNDFSFTDIASSIKEPSTSTLIGIPLTILGPTFTSNSLIDINTGLIASQNSSHTDVFSVNSGFDVGLQSTTHNTSFMSNYGLCAANQVTLTGCELQNQGMIANHERMTVNFNDIKNDGAGVINGKNASISAETLTNNADLTLDTSRVNVKEVIDIEKNGKTAISNSHVTAGELNNDGSLHLTKSTTHIEETITVKDHGEMHIDESQVSANNITNDGTYKQSKSVTDVRNQLTNNNMFEQTESLLKANSAVNTGTSSSTKSMTDIASEMENSGSIHQAESIVKTKGLINTGSYVAEKSATEVQGETVNEGLFQQTESSLKTETLANSGTSSSTRSITEVENGTTNSGLLQQDEALFKSGELTNIGTYTANKSATEVQTHTLNEGQFQQTESSFKSGTLNNTGSSTSIRSATDIAKGIANSGTLAQDESIMKADSFSNTGINTATKSLIDVQGAIDNAGEMSHTESVIKTEQINNTGTYDAKESLIEARKTIANQGHLNFTETSVHSERYINEGTQKIDASEIQVAKDYVQTKSGTTIANSALIESQSQSLDGHHQTANTLFHAEKDVDVKKTASFKVEGITQISGENVKFSAKVENNDTLTIIAEDDLTLTRETRVTGTNGTLNLSSNHAHIEGKIAQKNIAMEINHLDNALDIITGNGSGKDIQATDQFYCKTGEELDLTKRNKRECNVAILAKDVTVSKKQECIGNYHLEASEGNVVINADVHSDRDLTIKAKQDIDNNGRTITAGHDAYVNAGHSVHNIEGKIIGDHNTFISGETGEVRNTGGTLQGKNHIQVVSKTGIVNEAVEHDIKGKHDTLKEYQRGNIIGGDGEGFDGNGVVLITDGKLTNDASSIVANGHVGVSAKEGVDSTARTHVYLSEKYSYRSGLFNNSKTKVKIYDAQVEKSLFGSKSGKITILSEHGGVNTVATDFMSEGETIIIAEKKIALYDLIAERRVYKNKSGCFGFTHEKQQWMDEFSSPTTLHSASKNGIRLYSTRDDVYLRGTIAYTPGKFYANGEEVTSTISTLRHEYSRKSSGFDLSMFGQSIANSNAPKNNAPLPFHNGETVYNHLESLTNSNGTAEMALNSMNTAITLANTSNSIAQGIRNGNLLKESLNHFGYGNIDPSITLTYSKEEEHSTYESMGEGSITSGSAEFIGRSGNVTLEGLPVNVAGDTEVTCVDFIQRGMDLHSTHTKHNSSVGVGFSGKSGSPTDISIQDNHSSETRHDHVNQETNIGGKLKINAKSWKQDGANADVGSLAGHVELHEVTTHTSGVHSTSSSAGASTTGEFNIAHNKTDAEIITQTAGVHIKGDDSNEQSSFHADVLHNKGGVIDGDGKSTYHADHTMAEDVKEYSRSTGFSMAGNINDITPTQNDPNVINTNKDEGQTIKTIDLSLSNSDYQAEQHATVALANSDNFTTDQVVGNLVTDASQSKEIIRDESHTYTAEVPVYNESTLTQMRDNANWLESKVTGKPYQPTIPLSQAILSHEKLNTPEEVAAYVDKIKNMEAMSEAAYGDNTVPAGFHTLSSNYNSKTDEMIVSYINDATGELVFAFRGTQSTTNLLNDDVDIALGRAPGSFDDAARQYIENTMSLHPGCKVVFTGHSMGAANAALASDYFGQPAYVFDNPGIYNPNHKYNFSQVTSFQGQANIVNHAGPLTGRSYDQGKIIQLSATDVQRLIAEGAQQLGAGGLLVSTTYGHKMSEINRELTDHLDKQLQKARLYGSPSSSNLFKLATTNDNSNSIEQETPKCH